MDTSTRAGEEIAGGRYKLLKPLGRGTFGDVYLAESSKPETTQDQREVVVKILHAQWAQVPEVVERFRREAQVTQKIDHPHVAKIFDYTEMDDGVPCIVMEYLPGNALRDQLDHARIGQQPATKILIDIAEALAAAHKAGVVHRDLKPDNIQLVERDGTPFYPVVLDFGVAKFLDAAEKLTMTGALLGTPIYMSPEQFRGESNLGPPSDIYAFGVLAYELYAGQPPFTGTTFAELALAHTNKPAKVLPGANKGLSDLLLRCLDKDPNKRPRAEAIANSLRAIAAGLPPGDSLANEPEIDPFAATSAGANAALAETIRATVSSSAKPVEATLPTRPSNPGSSTSSTLFLALVVFLLTSGLGLAVYFYLL
jgi:serine/threonine-protein kinase